MARGGGHDRRRDPPRRRRGRGPRDAAPPPGAGRGPGQPRAPRRPAGAALRPLRRAAARATPSCWTSPPFEPTVRDGNLYARGASDDKGNLFMLLAAVQRLAAAGELPVRAAFVVEGEEESGGTSALEHFAGDPGPAIGRRHLRQPHDRPRAARRSAPACAGWSSAACASAPRATDGHSGLYGGAALNAGHALMRILAAVTPHEGRLPDAALRRRRARRGAEEVAAWDDLPPGAEALADGRPAARRRRRGRGLLHAHARLAVARRARPRLRRAHAVKTIIAGRGLGDAVAAPRPRPGRPRRSPPRSTTCCARPPRPGPS